MNYKYKVSYKITMLSKTETVKKVLKVTVITVCLVGFSWQTFLFLLLYWTYPTVVDIQVSVPSEIDMPGITICSGSGIKPEVICEMGSYCSDEQDIKESNLCEFVPEFCKKRNPPTPPDGFRAVAYQRFFSDKDMNSTVVAALTIPLKDFFRCKIVSGSSERDCDLDNAITGPYYSDGNVPNFCFSMYTFWSQPKKNFQKIKKSEKIVMEFHIDTSFKDKNAEIEKIQLPAYNSLSSSSVQIAMHSPYIAASPYVSGVGLIGGKDYRIQVREDEKHLLPPPYQTNCTDYMAVWKARGGVGPLNQGMVIQECKLNETLRQLGCVPFYVDYPHNATICHFCENCPNLTKVGDNCTNLLQYYNQPCDFVNYNMDVEEKLVNIKKKLESAFIRWKETLYFKEKGYDCSDQKVFSRRCQTINVEVVFDDFEITNITYIPKFESLELFSVIGGYMGMYLGVSIVAIYDFAEVMIGAIYSFVKKRRNAKKKLKEQQKNSMWLIKATTKDVSENSIRKRNRIRNIY